MSSSIPNFKSALKSRLEADINLSGVQISWGNPYPKRMQDELVIIGNAENERQTPIGFATSAQEEEYSIEILVSVVGASRLAYETLETRAFEIAAAVENNIIAWRDTAFDEVVSWALVGGMNSREIISEDGSIREASVSFRIYVTARI